MGLITFCFDDGRHTASTHGAGILRKYDFLASFYPITSRVGLKSEMGDYSSWEDISALQEMGHEVGSHSHGHSMELVSYDERKLRADISESINLLRARGIIPISFVYPFGRQNEQFRQVIEELGFSCARTTNFGINNKNSAPFLLRSLSIKNTHSVADLEPILRQTLRDDGWLILNFHHLDDKTKWSTTSCEFERMAEKIASMALSAVTLRQGREWLSGKTQS